MKKIIILLIFIVFTIPVLKVSAQSPLNFRPDFEEMLTSFPSLGNVKIKNNRATSTFSLSKVSLEDSLHQFTKEQLSFEQRVDFSAQFPRSKATLPGILSPGGIHFFDNGLNYSSTEPQLIIKSIYSEGKAWTFTTGDTEGKSGEMNRFRLDKSGNILTKPDIRIDSMQVSYKYLFCTEAEVIVLSTQNPVYEKGEETIRLTRAEDNQIELEVSFPAFERIVRIEGTDSKKKRMLSDLTWTSGYLSKDLVQLYIEMKNTDWVKEARPDSAVGDEGYPMVANFLSPPSEVHIFLSTERESISGNLMVYPDIYTDSEEEPEIGVFYQSDKAGIINSRGKILVEPLFQSLEHLGGVIFYGQREDDDNEELYKMDLGNNELVPVGYKYYKPTSYTRECDGQIKVHEYMDEPIKDSYIRYGVMDYKGNMIVPVLYDRVVTCLSFGKLILVRQYEDGNQYRSVEGLYNSAGIQLLPVIYENIIYEDFVVEAYKKDDSNPEVYFFNPATGQLDATEKMEYEISASETLD